MGVHAILVLLSWLGLCMAKVKKVTPVRIKLGPGELGEETIVY